jgi:putative sterol carrier protein
MARYLSPEWVQSFDAALGALDLTDAIATAGEGSLLAADGSFTVAQVVEDVPAAADGSGTVRTVLTIAEGRAHLALDPDGTATSAADVTMLLGYVDALAMARGELQPAEALAGGRIRVRGDLSALVAAQAVLQAASAQLGSALEDLTDPPDAAG